MTWTSIAPRGYASAFITVILVTLFLVVPAMARRVRRPAMVLGAGIYWGLLHLVALYGLLSSTQFETAIAPLMVLTFPFNILTAENHYLPGFATLHDLAANYLRYIVAYGGLNALVVAAFFALVVRPRALPAAIRASRRA